MKGCLAPAELEDGLFLFNHTTTFFYIFCKGRKTHNGTIVKLRTLSKFTLIERLLYPSLPHRLHLQAYDLTMPNYEIWQVLSDLCDLSYSNYYYIMNEQNNVPSRSTFRYQAFRCKLYIHWSWPCRSKPI